MNDLLEQKIWHEGFGPTGQYRLRPKEWFEPFFRQYLEPAFIDRQGDPWYSFKNLRNRFVRILP